MISKMYFDKVCFIELCNIFFTVSKFGKRQKKAIMFRINNFDIFEISQIFVETFKVKIRPNIVHITTLGGLCILYKFFFSLDRFLQNFQIRKNYDKLYLISLMFIETPCSDSGAVYTLALKTHVGMSIDTWRYFAGWCDKVNFNLIKNKYEKFYLKGL